MRELFRPAKTRTPALMLALSLCCVLSLSCARRPSLPTQNIGYDRLQVEFSAVDASALNGRHIMLDPGHGGVFPGVVGRDGLSEADANLGVALYLRGLLEARGARVTMTRTDDSDLLSPGDSTLSFDLAQRVALCDSLRPDVFVSLHHNSNAALDRERNETQTYYPVGRDGADQDLARAVHKHLARNLGIRPARIMAGNFHVLRNAPVTAILGEPSMLSNPGVEAKLAKAEKMELEAQAYFLGLVEYFSGGQPSWATHDLEMWRQGKASWTFQSGPGGPRLDPTSIVFTVNEKRATYDLGAWTEAISWAPDYPLAQGTYEIKLRARNLAGRATSTLQDTLVVLGGRIHFEVVSVQEHADNPAPRQRLIRWRAVGTAGEAVPLSGPAWIGSGSRGDLKIGDAGQSSGALLMEADGPELSTLRVRGPSGEEVIHPLQVRSHGLQEGLKWVYVQSPEPDDNVAWTIRNLSGLSCSSKAKGPEILDRRLPFIPISPTSYVWLERPGYQPIFHTPADAWADTLHWVPLLPSLHGKVVVIDPTGGAADDQGVAPMGTPGRELNLRVAERLAELLRGAGATPILTRTDVHRLPDQEKVLLANLNHADLFLTLARHSDTDGWRLSHHYGSLNGERWARLTAEALAACTKTTPPVEPSYTYLLRHTAPPAILCEIPLAKTESEEEHALLPSVQQSEALALFRAVAAYFQESEHLPSGIDLHSLIRNHSGFFPEPRDIDLIRVDGNLLWLPQHQGAVNGDSLPLAEGRHILEVRSTSGGRLLEVNTISHEIRELLRVHDMRNQKEN